MARFKDTDPNAGGTAAQVRLLTDKQARINRLETNINAFIAVVADVTFNVDEADAQSWMRNWQANLLSGSIQDDPKPEPAEEEAAAE